MSFVATVSILASIKQEKKILHLFSFLLLVWIVGGLLVFAVEHDNPEFASPGDAVWNIAVYLFSGLDSGKPQTPLGKILVIAILISSTIALALITGSLASMFMEIRTKGQFNMPDKYKPQDHYVICNWNNKSIPLIQQMHADELEEKRTIIIISDNQDACDFGNELSKRLEMGNVFLIKGDPAESYNLQRAHLEGAHSIIILADMEDKVNADGKSIFICMAIKELLEEANLDEIDSYDKTRRFITVEAMNPSNVKHFERAGANEVICEEEFGMLLLSQSAYQHGLASVFKDLMTFSDDGDDSNELYRMVIPEEDIKNKITFTELAAKINKNRDPDDPVVLVGGYSGTFGRYILNPKVSQVFEEGDEALLLAWSKPKKLY